MARDAPPPAKSKKDKGKDKGKDKADRLLMSEAPRVALILGTEMRGEAGAGAEVEPQVRSLQVAARRLIQVRTVRNPS